MSLENESGPFELLWGDFTALSKWLKKHPPPKNHQTRRKAQRGRRDMEDDRSSKSRGSRAWSLIVWLLIALCCGLLYVTPQVSGPGYLVLGAACLVGGFVAGAMMMLAILAWAKVFHPQTEKTFLALPADQWQRGPWRVRISPEGIENISPHATAMYRWEVIWSMGQTEDHLIYMISSQRGVAVPRRAFISDEHFDDFADTAKRYRRQAEQILDAEPVAPEEEAPRPERPSTDIRL
jgi:hypothetical protein